MLHISTARRALPALHQRCANRAILRDLMMFEKAPYAASSMVLLPRLTKQVIRRSNPELLGMDLRLLMALSYLADHDGAPQQELVDALCMDAKNVVLILNELEDCGHLIRRRDTEDRRRHRVHITPG